MSRLVRGLRRMRCFPPFQSLLTAARLYPDRVSANEMACSTDSGVGSPLNLTGPAETPQETPVATQEIKAAQKARRPIGRIVVDSAGGNGGNDEFKWSRYWMAGWVIAGVIGIVSAVGYLSVRQQTRLQKDYNEFVKHQLELQQNPVRDVREHKEREELSEEARNELFKVKIPPKNDVGKENGKKKLGNIY